MITGNPPGVPGEDAYHDGLLKQHLDEQEAWEAWQARVSSGADEIQADDPETTREEAVEEAERQIRADDSEAEEAYFDSVAYDRGMG